ncbi:MAG: sulfotransferase [Methylophilaceae bacterium]|nr:sulfotransferase [Methylophilaceae bacterium]
MDPKINNQFNIAKKYFNESKITQAEEIATELVSKNSKVVEINYFLGLIKIRLKKYHEAIEILEKSNKIKKNFEHTNLLLGIAYTQLKNFVKALNFLKKELQNYPNKIDAYINLSNLYIELKDFKLSEYYLTKAKEIDPIHPVIYEIEGLNLFRQQKYSAALSSYELAIQHKPKSIEVIFNIAKIHEKLFKYSEAKTYYLRAINLAPNNGFYSNEYANFLNKIGYEKEAYDFLEKNWQDFSGIEKCRALETLAKIASGQNLLEASTKFHELFLLNNIVHPNFMAMLYGYSEIREIHLDSDIFKRAKQVFDHEKIDNKQKAYYFFVLADIYKKNDAEKYVESLVKANSFLKKYRKYNFEEDASKFKKIYAVDNLLNQYELEKSKKVNPIFIVGMPRSGTTLVEQIISSHPEVYGAGEIHLLSDELENFFKKAVLSLEALEIVKNKYEHLLSTKKESKKYHTDKYPLNFLYINFIIKFFPNAKIINIDRDKNAIIFSIFSRYIGDKLGCSCDIKDLNHYYLAYQKLMLFWKKKYPNHIYNLSYEQLTENPEIEIKKLIEFCGLDWNKSCLNHENNKRVINTPSKFQARQKIYKNSSLVWKKYADFFPALNEISN